MDDPNNNFQTGPEVYCEAITAADMVKDATLVMDRVTGEAYNPQAKFDEMMNKPEIQAVFKRLSIR